MAKTMKHKHTQTHTDEYIPFSVSIYFLFCGYRNLAGFKDEKSEKNESLAIQDFQAFLKVKIEKLKMSI